MTKSTSWNVEPLNEDQISKVMGQIQIDLKKKMKEVVIQCEKIIQ